MERIQDRATGDKAQVAQEIIHSVVRIYYVIESRVNTAGQRMNSQSFGVLFRLYEAEGRALGMTQLARKMAVSKPQLSKLVGGLEEARLVERTHDVRDRRSVRVALTEAGIQRVDQVFADDTQRLARRIEHITPERVSQIREGLRLLYDAD